MNRLKTKIPKLAINHKKPVFGIFLFLFIFSFSFDLSFAQTGPYSQSESFRVLDSINLGGGQSESESFRVLELIDELDGLIYEEVTTVLKPAIEVFLESAPVKFARNALVIGSLVFIILLSLIPLLFRLPSFIVGFNLFKDLWRLLFGWLGRRKKSGIVFDSVNGKGIESANVRLIAEGGGRFEPGKVVSTAVTDEKGYYSFKIEPGKYRIEVTAFDFAFPSKRRREDYHGETVDASNQDHFNPDIPIDSFDPEASISARSFNNIAVFLDAIRLPMMMFGTVLSIVFYLYYNATIDLVILIIYLFMWLLELHRLHQMHISGHIYSPYGPVHSAIVRLFDFDGNLLATSVSQRNGEYSIFAPAGVHKLEIARTGFKSITKIIKVKESKVLTNNIRIYGN